MKRNLSQRTACGRVVCECHLRELDSKHIRAMAATTCSGEALDQEATQVRDGGARSRHSQRVADGHSRSFTEGVGGATLGRRSRVRVPRRHLLQL
eukprot:9138063-Pyramimonas_sp.AAC.1